jgi:hypothetical protein
VYVYLQSEPGLFTVGFYTPEGGWMPESDWLFVEKAAERVHYLNGGQKKDEGGRMPVYCVRVLLEREFFVERTAPDLASAKQWAEDNKDWIVQGEFGAEDDGRWISVEDVFEKPEGNK